jgi:hypothetical protein
MRRYARSIRLMCASHDESRPTLLVPYEQDAVGIHGVRPITY